MPVTSVRLAPEIEQRLQRWAETVEALTSVRAGRVVDGDEMMQWIASWGRKLEKDYVIRYLTADDRIVF